jgi:predicted phage terminase large subunit-like protein
MRLEDTQHAHDYLIPYAMLMEPHFQNVAHQRIIARELENVCYGKVNRLIIEAPPRHGKSLLTSQYFPAWYLGHHPNREVIFGTYSDDLVKICGRAVRNYIMSPTHGQVFKRSRLSRDSKSKDEFAMSAGGAYHGTGVGGGITGKGGHLIILDDTLKGRKQAASQVYRDELHGWYETDIYTRGNPTPADAAIVIMQTRWHTDDLIGYVLKEHKHENWRRIKLPVMSKLGIPLWPERFTLEKIEKIRATMSEKDFQALYMQRPVVPEGNIIKRNWFKFYQKLNDNRPYLWEQSWDTSVKEGKDNSFVVGQVWAKDGHKSYLVYQYRKQAGFPETVRAMRMVRDMFPQTSAVYVEDKANGPACIATLQSEFGGIIEPVDPARIGGSKEARLENVAYIIEGGNVFLPDPNLVENFWVKDYIYEMVAFPNGEFDDQVDTTSQYLNKTFNSAVEEFRRIL